MKFNDLYLDYEYEDLELKMALKAVIHDEKVVNEAVKHYQMGKAQDLIYAEQALAKGAFFGTVNKIIGANIQKRAKARPAFDDKLRKALIRAGKLPDLVYNYQAHHIVAKRDSRSQRAVEILQALGIDIDDPSNGVFLPANNSTKKKSVLKKAYIHNNVHTAAYHSNVTFEVVALFQRTARLSNDERKRQMMKLLNRIGKQLREGEYPLYSFIPGAEHLRG